MEFPFQQMPTVPSLLVVTPTLGHSPYLPGMMKDVARIARSVVLQQVVVAPEATVGALRRQWPSASIAAEPPECGMYGAINAAADAAGDWEWLTWINDDDLLLPGFQEVWRRAQAEPTVADVWYGEVDYLDADGRKVAAMPVCRRPTDVPALLAAGLAPFTQQGALISRDLWRKIGGMDASLRIAGDFDFWVRAAAIGAHFKFVCRTVAAFRVRGGQLSGNARHAKDEEAKVLRRHNLQVSRVCQQLAALRFRAQNLPRILHRVWRTGHLSSRGMFAR